MTHILRSLREIVGESGLLTGDATARHTALGESTGRPLAIVRPVSTAQVSTILRLCNSRHQPVVTHGGLTGVVGGTLAMETEVVLSLERMKSVEEIDSLARTMTVQAGVPVQVAQEQAEVSGLMFPLDLGSRGTATVGGVISTNAGGNRVIRFGMTRDMVLGLEVVLADGTIIDSLGHVIKNNTGYDLKQLFIGAEGTLGVVTRAVLRLREAPQSHNTAFVALDSFEALTTFLRSMDRVSGGALSAFEVMWRDFYKLLISQPSPACVPLPDCHDYYVLVESLGGDADRDGERFEHALATELEAGRVADAVVAKSEGERAAMWKLRDEVSACTQFAPLFNYDVSAPLGRMQEYIADIQRELRARWPRHKLFVFGHLGDSNLHVVISVGSNDPATRQRVDDLVLRPLHAWRGSVSAEHGIGLDKRKYLPVSRSEAEIEMMRRFKRTLDPHGILNPGKIFAS